ncbi:amidohydrolase [Halanaerobium congolense]|uniref:Amidohydrolase n=1 Tax=Halanaerobium congolense TaxID=54121 RepID=A0A1G7H3I5_9FIRM|nr:MULTISPECIES: M20 family metallopeptidase [Halanaerobium]KXS49543.1 MAG: amidohydrolase [Halanaerobium sp. T82-1]PTX17586.1 amidohydrolase [Halanaerobium congolense]PUU88676.1 MAG: amidohydrolase [Halanaerobium sp.]PUU91281.1 MAG: amidohydrolase [Halanaerobium sp.]TDS28943.1 amidohydrolase [Halanaerobium congolense]
MDFKNILAEQEKYVLDLRREFHMHPETSWNEKRTSKRIKEELAKMGISYQEYADTGVAAVIKGSNAGKTAALRADMDALKVEEKTDLEFKSKNEGIMHACGHDGHTAMLLGTARALYEIRDQLAGNVKLIFQPAEEMVQGAAKMVEEGVLDDVDGIMGIHLWADLPTGKINVEAGPRMASGDYVIVEFTGKGGHGSMPHQGVDPIVMASSFVLDSQAILSRETNSLDPVVLTFGKMKSGSRFNVIPDKAEIVGTLRCFSEKTRVQASKAIKRYAEKTAKAYRGEAEVTIQKGTPPTINDQRAAEIARSAAQKIIAAEDLIAMDKTTGSEDMAYYLREVPGVIAFVGAGFEDEEQNYPHHNSKFKINEDSLKTGTSLYFNFALEFLRQF